VPTLASVTALLASAAAVIASGSSLIAKVWTGAPKIQISLLSPDPLRRRIPIAALNKGGQTGIVYGFSLHMSVSDKTRGRSYSLDEPLAVGPKKEDMLVVRPLPYVANDYLVPSGSDQRFNVRESLLGMTPNLAPDELKQEQEEFQQSFKDAASKCEVFYQTQSADPAQVGPVLAGEISQCHEFMLRAYQL
jgi:hypothetical protein